MTASSRFRHGLPRKPRIFRQKWATPPRRPVIVTAMPPLRTWMDHMLNRFALTTQVPHSGTEKGPKTLVPDSPGRPAGAEPRRCRGYHDGRAPRQPAALGAGGDLP